VYIQITRMRRTAVATARIMKPMRRGLEVRVVMDAL